MVLSPVLITNGVMKAVIIEIIPIIGNKNALTAPISTPTFIITIENSPLGERASEERSVLWNPCLNKNPPNKVPPNFTNIYTAMKTKAISM